MEDSMESQQDENQSQRDHPSRDIVHIDRDVDTQGGTFVGGNVSTGGGDFISGSKITIINPPPLPPIVSPEEDLKKEQEKHKDNPLLQTIYDEQECEQTSQISLNHLISCMHDKPQIELLKTELAELEAVHLVKHITHVENQRTYDFYSITDDGKVLVLRRRSQLQSERMNG
jgi:hypothetical protein